jgi:sec-independent protein translocase protein TatA
MGEFSVYHWLIVLFIILLLFGGRRIPELMKGMGQGIRSFKDGITGKDSSTSTLTATRSDAEKSDAEKSDAAKKP